MPEPALDLAGLARGGVTRRPLHVAELLDGTPVTLPLTVVAGARPGPVLYVGAAIHGDEVTGIEVLRRLARDVDPATLRGTLLLLPVQNPIALRDRGRLLPLGTTDGYATDVHTAFPGAADGELSAQLAHRLLHDVIARADAAIDLHAPLVGGLNLDYVFTPSPQADPGGRARELALAFGTRAAIVGASGPYVAPSMLHEAASRAGVPTFTVEFAANGAVDAASARLGVQGVLNVMRQMEMVPGATQAAGGQVIGSEVRYARTTRGGLADIRCKPGQTVRAGDLLGVVHDVWFDAVERVLSPVDGLVYRVALPRMLNGAERLAGILVPDPAATA